MNGRGKLGAVVVASVIVLCAGQLAFPQVDWAIGDVVVSPEPGWDRHVPGDLVFDGTTYHMYLIGGPGITPIGNVWMVGHWTSTDGGLTWWRDPYNPVLEPEPGQWDGGGIGSIAVLYHEGMFHMWYGAAAAHLAPPYAGYATSPGGSVWTKYAGNPLAGLEPGPPGSWDDYGMAPGSVLVEGSALRMWYIAFEGGYWGHPWTIGQARSTDDGITWTKEPDAPVLEATEPWEGSALYNPTVVLHGGSYHMWYTGIGVTRMGYASSSDGLSWRKWPGNPVLTPVGCSWLDSLAVLLDGDTIHGWVGNCYDVRAATSSWFFADDFETGTTDLWSVVVP